MCFVIGDYTPLSASQNAKLTDDWVNITM